LAQQEATRIIPSVPARTDPPPAAHPHAAEPPLGTGRCAHRVRRPCLPEHANTFTTGNPKRVASL